MSTKNRQSKTNFYLLLFLMTEPITIALLGISGSFIVAFVTAYFTSKRERQKLNHQLLENLYEKRFSAYKKLLEITQDIGKKQTSYEEHKKAREALKEWIATSGGYLLLTSKTLGEINTMKDLLKKGKSNTEGWEKEHIRKIFECRNRLRGALRDEFSFFHSAENSV